MIRDNLLRDLTLVDVNFVDGESPVATKLEGMMTQIATGLAYLEAAFGDAFGEDEKFNTWMSSVARDIGDRSKINPSILPNQSFASYSQQLILGKTEHELDLIPVGNDGDVISSSTDSCVNVLQYKNSASALEVPGDWTIASGYIENGKHKRSRKLITHSPSEGGAIVMLEVTSGRGSSLEDSLENLIPNEAQAKDTGPFIDVFVADAEENKYTITLPLRTKMYDKTGNSIDFSASNTASGVGLNSQYELPPFFFGVDGLDLDSDEAGGGAKYFPLNLIRIYDYSTKKEVEGILNIQASPSQSARKYQFIVQMRSDIILDDSSGTYVIAVPGNSITQQLKGLTDSVYNDTGLGVDMTRLISHKNLLGLRTSNDNYTERSLYYGPSSIDNNDHSHSFHRNGFTDNDKGAGGNVIRGDVVVGNTDTGTDDLIHENYNVDNNSYKLFFGDRTKGGATGYLKTFTHILPNTYGSIPASWTDPALEIIGAEGETYSGVKTSLVNGDFKATGNVVLGTDATNEVAIPGTIYIGEDLNITGDLLANGSILAGDGIVLGATIVLLPSVDPIGSSTTEGMLGYDSDLKDIQYYDGTNKKTLLKREDDSVEPAALNIDWKASGSFYKTITASQTFTFSNVADGQTIIVVIENSTGSDLTAAFPKPAYWQVGLEVDDVYANSKTIYTFSMVGNEIYANGTPELTEVV